jgi:DnaJ-class molecular chaperone
MLKLGVECPQCEGSTFVQDPSTDKIKCIPCPDCGGTGVKDTTQKEKLMSYTIMGTLPSGNPDIVEGKCEPGGWVYMHGFQTVTGVKVTNNTEAMASVTFRHQDDSFKDLILYAAPGKTEIFTYQPS